MVSKTLKVKNRVTVKASDSSSLDLATLTSAQGFKVLGAASGDNSGWSVASAGDINNDGYSDVIIGAYFADPNGRAGAGTSYVIFGKESGFADIDLASLSASQGFKILGAVSGDSSGWSVASAGDINNDGYSDVIIGAYFADPNGRTDAGTSYVIFGKESVFTDIDLASLSESQGFKVLGAASYDQNARSVASAGDVNADGYDDILIGAEQFGQATASAYGAGICYVIFGKASGFANIDLASLSSSQGYKIFGASLGDRAGFSVSGAGDVNGDGYSDIIIGAIWADRSGKNNAGASYLIFGKDSGFPDIYLSSLSSAQGFKISGENANDWSGCSVSSIGDINTDGYGDIIIGTDQADPNGRTDAGAAYVIFGKASGLADVDLATLTASQGFKILGAASGDSIARLVAGAGDINNDGYNDMIIGSYGADPNARNSAGISYIIFGSTSGFTTASPTLQPTHQPTTQPTNSPTYNPSVTPTGIPTFNPSFKPTLSPTSFPTFPTFCPSLAPSSKPSVAPTSIPTNSPTFAPSSNPTMLPTYSPTHIPTMLSKSISNLDLATLNSNQGFSIQGASTADRAAYSVSKAGDFDGDGFKDIIIGSPYENDSVGAAYIVFGNYGTSVNIDLASLSDFSDRMIKITGVNVGDNTGWSVSSAGDFNNDGYDDVIVTAKSASDDSGVVFIVFGNERVLLNDIDLVSADPSQAIKIYGLNSGSNLGISSANLGDFNGDKYSDIILGSNGAAYVIFGTISPQTIYLPSLISIQGIKIANNNVYPIAVGGGGDINNDNYNDATIGIYQETSNGKLQAGLNCLLYGHVNPSDIDLSNFNSNDGFIIYGASQGDTAGMAVSIAKSINGDIFDDILIGAPGADPKDTLQDSGVVYVIWGKRDTISNIDLMTFDNSMGIKIYGAAKNDKIGVSVSSSGDLNGDRIFDIIIGAPNSSPNDKSKAGQSYVIFGKDGLNSDIDLSILSNSQGFKIFGSRTGDASGLSVSGIDDFNKDGYDDVIVGAFNADDNSRINSGTAYILYDVSATNSPTLAPTFTPTAPTLHPTYSPTLSPTLKPTQTENAATSYSDNWWDSSAFEISSSVVSPVLSFAAAWVFRENIAFYILNNWGYRYKCLYNSKESVSAGEIGFFLSTDKKDSSVVHLHCKVRDKVVLLDEDNSKNHGMPTKVYHMIFNELKEPTENFVFLESEKNELLNFFLTRPKLIEYGDLGIFKGFVYQILINSEYKRKYEDSKKYVVRLKEDGMIESDRNYETENPITAIEMENLGVNDDHQTISTDTQSSESKSLQSTQDNKKGCVLMSIDASIDYEHVRLQNEELSRFNNYLMHFMKEEVPQDIAWIIKSTESKIGTVLLGDVTREGQTMTNHDFITSTDNSQFSSSNNVIPSLISVKQILHNLPIIQYLAQSSINYLGYNVSLPNPLDNKAVLISADLIVGNLAAQYLPDDSIMNGMFISTASTAGYAVSLETADYIRNQELPHDPIEFAGQCAATITAYALPQLFNYALTKAILPDSKLSINTLDMLGSTSLGVAQCYNNYQAIYNTQAEAHTTDIVVPYIADAITLWSLSGYLNFDTSNTASMMSSVKNTISVAAAVYATDCVSSMIIDFVPEDVKEEYVDPVLDWTYETIAHGVDHIAQAVQTCF